MPEPRLFAIARRQLEICNACRYCEGYCAVFPALERRVEYSDGDVRYIANLCHDCGSCFYACPFAPPHEYGIDIPRTLARVRTETYRHYAWPRRLAALFASNWLVSLRAVLLGLIAVGVVSFALSGPDAILTPQTGPGSFYTVVPWLAMVIPAMLGGAFVVAAWVASGYAFWRDSAGGSTGWLRPTVVLQAVVDVLVLRWLRGGGPGCPTPGEEPSTRRWWFHALVFYGFLLTFASTCVAAFEQDVLGLAPPYPILSAPVALGVVGGLAMLAGAIGFLLTGRRRDPRMTDPEMAAADDAFVGLLGLASLTGLVLLVLRDDAWLGLALLVHLGVLAALYVMAPYSKFVHFVYRFVALVRNRGETIGERLQARAETRQSSGSTEAP
jgi:citrate/tricarballylate utilization protein